MIAEVTVFLAVLALGLTWRYLTDTFNHWKDKGVPYLHPLPLVGSMWRVITQREHALFFFQRAYREFEGHRFVGFFQGRRPSLLIRDPELVQHILIKDFSYFTDHGFEFNIHNESLMAKNMFTINGDEWRETRIRLSPVFTTGRLKSMTPLLLESAQSLIEYVGPLANKGADIDLKDLITRYTTSALISCFFGVKCDTIQETSSIFSEMVRKYRAGGTLQTYSGPSIFYLPGSAPIVGNTLFKKGCEDYFRSVFRDMLNLRFSSGSIRNDIMQYLIQLRDKQWPDFEDPKLTLDESTGFRDHIVAQAFIFYFAGFETTTEVLSFSLFELARKPEVQKRARENIEEVLKRYNGEVSYKALQEMTYLDCIMNEGLRMYPPVTSHFRQCTKNYIIPGTEVTVEQGTHIILPVYAMQNDPKYYPDPENFEPERFFPENLSEETKFVHTPFGDGPRQCFGMRFAKLQAKVALFQLLQNFEFIPSPSTRFPFRVDPSWFLFTTLDKVFARAVKLDNNRIGQNA